MLNKRESAQINDFLSVIADLGRCILDEVVTMEAIIEENKRIQQKQSDERLSRLRRAKSKSRHRV